MRCVSWNVAGIRACVRKNAFDFLKDYPVDILCLQETKAEEEQVKLPDWMCEMFPYRYWNSTDGTTQRKGFSGTSIFSKDKPITKIETPGFDTEGRIVALEYKQFIIITVYTPNSQNITSDRFNYRTKFWQTHFEEFIMNLMYYKNVIVCGDFNVAHKDDDVHHPEKHQNSCAGCYDIERQQFQGMLNMGLVDVFRKLNKDGDNYTYWDQKIPEFRKNNIGWRIDYFLANKKFMKYIKSSSIHKDIIGSDHCPIECELYFPPKKIN